MLLEVHDHTAEHSSCSSVSAAHLVSLVYARGLDGIVLTDHHYLWPSEELAPLRRAAEVPDDFLILSGQEVATEFGDVLVYGADRSFPRNTPLRDIRGTCPEAAVVWAHPYRYDKNPPDHKFLDGSVDAVEILNSNHTVRGNTRGLQDWHRLRFIATAGTDTHAASYAGTYPTLFLHPFETIEEMAREIKLGHCVPLLNEISHFGAKNHVTEVHLGRRDGSESQERIIVRSPAGQGGWDASARAFAVMSSLVERGFADGQFRVPRPIDSDPSSQMVIEQAVRGRSLYEELLAILPPLGIDIVRLTAQFLSRLHNLKLVVTSPDEFIRIESQRLAKYLKNFTRSNNPHAAKFGEIVKAVLAEETEIATQEHANFVQGHGDFHPKNILIGKDEQGDRYIAAIDFERSMVQPRAMDVGYFLAQFRNQFFDHPVVLRGYSDSVFVDAYLDSADEYGCDFLRQVELFRARANLGIASFFIDVGLGQSEKMWRVLVEAERALAVYRSVPSLHGAISR